MAMPEVPSRMAQDERGGDANGIPADNQRGLPVGRAKTSPTQARVQDSTANARDCTAKSYDSFAIYDQSGYCSKMSTLFSPEELEPYSESWPRAATGGPTAAYPLAPWVRPTGEIDGGR